MKTGRYIWIAPFLFFFLVGTYVLLDSVRRPGPYADEYILLGGTLTALGLAALFFGFEQYLQIRAMARHMRRGSYLSRKSRTSRI
ncbi:MAG TPA: hypothetical protein VKH15_07785 [Candidatus Acidoferrum sp.]|jgi:hypothetical protein|nr:hypothetical protein [Candidatus Acidoferrum sp.]